MKKIVTNYDFVASTKKITFRDYVSIDLKNLVLITNVTRNIIIYNFADATLGGTISGNILTLTYNTAASMADADVLQIIYDDTEVAPVAVSGEAGRKAEFISSPEIERFFSDLLEEVKKIKILLMEVME